jgi:hypothetical protein
MSRTSALTVALLAAALAPAGAWADGAFPDSFGIFAPSDQPQRLILSTNFGMIISEDNGATWYLVCENAENSPYASLYALGPPPADRIGVVSQVGLAISSDDACTWTTADGGVGNTYVEDFFFDPSDPNHALAIATAPNPDGGPEGTALFQSHNGGLTFDTAPIFQPPTGVGVLSMEISRSSPQTIYIALFESSPDRRALLGRSDDSGGTWQQFDVSGGAIGTKSVRIAAVDPNDATRVYLRVADSTAGQDALAIVTDGGASVTVPLQLQYPMSGFLHRSNGELLVTTLQQGSFRSVDQGQSFQPWEANLHLRGLTERGSTLFLVGDNFADNFAVAQSSDDGNTLTPLLQFDRICGLKACGNIASLCQATWSQLAQTLTIPDNACAAPPPTKGCGCAADAGVPLALMAALLLRLRRARRRGSDSAAPARHR